MNKSSHNNVKSHAKQEIAKTDPKKVRKEIQKDISEGQGDITSREAGSYRD